MCGFCEGNDSLPIYGWDDGINPTYVMVKKIFNEPLYSNIHIMLEDGHNILGYDNSSNEYATEYVEINYCPICGRKLKEDTND